MKFEEHCKECKEKLGNEWREVHIWLDEFAKSYGLEFHRMVRHHREGIEEVREKWGNEAAKAAYYHIASDYGGAFIPCKKDYRICGDHLLLDGYDVINEPEKD